MTTFMLIDRKSTFTFSSDSKIRTRFEQIKHFFKSGHWADFEQFDF